METRPLDRSEREMLTLAEGFDTPRQLIEWLLEKGVIDHKMCRVVVVKNHYRRLLKNGYKPMDAITVTADRFCISESTVQQAVYYFKDI